MVDKQVSVMDDLPHLELGSRQRWGRMELVAMWVGEWHHSRQRHLPRELVVAMEGMENRLRLAKRRLLVRRTGILYQRRSSPSPSRGVHKPIDPLLEEAIQTPEAYLLDAALLQEPHRLLLLGLQEVDLG